MTEPITPTVGLPLSEAVQELTGFEVLGIQSKFGTEMEKLGGVRTLLGAVWAFENRRAKTGWSTVEQMTLRELAGYFAPEDTDPDGEQGKGPPQPVERPSI